MLSPFFFREYLRSNQFSFLPLYLLPARSSDLNISPIIVSLAAHQLYIFGRVLCTNQIYLVARSMWTLQMFQASEKESNQHTLVVLNLS